MKINNQEVVGEMFAYDGCHKIYVIEDAEDRRDAIEYGYKVFPIDELEDAFDNSCELRFIHNWKLDKAYVPQFEEAHFE